MKAPNIIKPHVTPRKNPKQERSRELVHTILQATAHILDRGGLEAFNTNEIARVAGVSIGSVYQFFPNKDSILAAYVDRQMTLDFNRIIELLTSQRAAPKELLIESLVQELIDIFCRNRKLRQIIYQEGPRLELLKRREGYIREVRQMLRSILFEEKFANENQVKSFEVVFRAVMGVIISSFTDDSFNFSPLEMKKQLLRLFSMCFDSD